MKKITFNDSRFWIKSPCNLEYSDIKIECEYKGCISVDTLLKDEFYNIRFVDALVEVYVRGLIESYFGNKIINNSYIKVAYIENESFWKLMDKVQKQGQKWLKEQDDIKAYRELMLKI